MKRLFLGLLAVFSMTSSYADSGSSQSGALSNVGYSSTDVVVPVNANTSAKEAVSHTSQNEVAENFSNLGEQKKGLSVNMSRDDDADCSDTINKCSFKSRLPTVQQATHKNRGVVPQQNNNFGVQIQR